MMGASSKHKSKDRDKKEKHRHKHKKDRSQKRHRKDKDDEDERSSSSPPPPKIIKKEPSNDNWETTTVYSEAGSGRGAKDSISIEETNKLRLKLGLKPLDVGPAPGTNAGKDNDPEGAEYNFLNEKKDFVHKPAESITQKNSMEKLKEKIATMKQKRMQNDKLSKVKTLAESDSDDGDDVISWVERSRKKQTEKERAAARAKMLEQMDEEFGVGKIVEQEFVRERQHAYSSGNLRGLTVQHDLNRFEEGRNIILTLEDKGVLDDTATDTLVNVNLMDDEKAEVNSINRKRKPGSNLYEGVDEDLDEYGAHKKKTVLTKYDEEIDGKQKKSFTIGSCGAVDMQQQRQKEVIKKKLANFGKTELSLDVVMPKMATEYYTEDDLVQFKKPRKKVRKVLRKKHKGKLSADDLLDDDVPLVTRKDHGARAGSSSSKVKSNQGDWAYSSEVAGFDFKKVKTKSVPDPTKLTEDLSDNDMDVDMDSDDDMGPLEDLTSVVLEQDEAELQLQLGLTRARKLKASESFRPNSDTMAESVLARQETLEEAKERDREQIVLNSTAEFCRVLGDIPTYGQAGNRDEDEDELAEFERELQEERRRLLEQDDEMAGGGVSGKKGWNEVSEMDVSLADLERLSAPILDEEPDVGTGMAGALKLAVKKGYLDDESKKMPTATKKSYLQAQHYTIEDKTLDDDKYSRRSDRFNSGPIMDFRERDGYKPGFKLEYMDDGGRKLNEKEAFRVLSHKFHGKGSGKNKTEKRYKKQQEENLMLQMSSTDTPLHTLAMLQTKQKQMQSPFIVMSGGSKALSATALSKK